MVRYKTMVKQKQVAVDGQNSGAPTEAKLVQPPVLPAEFFVELWNWEIKDQEPRGLFRVYERQCQFFMLLMGLERGTWIDHSRFQQVWQQSETWGVENLFAEILARREIYLSDPYSAFIVIGDLGARVLLYYVSLEHQWLMGHQIPAQIEKRKVSWQEYGSQMSSQFYSQPLSKLQPWEDKLHILLVQVQKPGFLADCLSANTQRLAVTSSEDFSASHYLFQFDRVVHRLERYLNELASQKKPLLNLNGQVQFDLPPADFTTVCQPMDLPVIGSPLTLRFLGQYSHLFDAPEEEPIPTWTAITWLLEDYGLSRMEDVPADIQYKRISRQWSATPPAAVVNHPHFCPCPRRNKWDPAATISSVEYNWPLIIGPKFTAADCQATYKRFFREHNHHCDPVCFRAAVFCNILADWCGQWNVTIDINQFSESHHEFLLLLKLQYRPTRWVRLVEVMAISHFIAGAHKCLINEFPNTRAGPFERFLRWQRLHAPELVARDEDVQKALEKVETRELKRGAAEAAHWGGPPPKLLRK